MKTKISISKRNLLLFGLPILGLMFGLLGNFALIAPQRSKAQQLDAQIQTAQAQVLISKQQGQKPATKPKAAKPVPVQAADIFRLTKAMPDSNDLPGILLHLSLLAKASSITLESVTPAARVPLPNGYGALPLSVVVTGKFDHVAGFLQRIRQQAVVGKNGKLRVDGRLFVANQVALTSTDGRSVSATLSLDAFVYGAGLPPVAPVVATVDPAAAGSAG